jgi:hypothetical protein
MNFGYFLSFQTLDKGLIEKFGPSGFTISIYNLSSNLLSRSSSGFLYLNLFLIIFFALFYLSSFFYFYTILSYSLNGSLFGFFFLSYVFALMLDKY